MENDPFPYLLAPEGIETIGVVPYITGIGTIKGHTLFRGPRFGLVLHSLVGIDFRFIPMYIWIVRIFIHYLAHHITITKFVVAEDKGSQKIIRIARIKVRALFFIF